MKEVAPTTEEIDAGVDPSLTQLSDQRIGTPYPQHEIEELLDVIPEELQAHYIKRFDDAEKSTNLVKATTGRDGVLFELHRINKVASSGLEEVDFSAIEGLPQISYKGYDAKGLDLSQPATKDLSSVLDLDVPLVHDGQPYAYEVKQYPRMPYGSRAPQVNQLLKYQEASRMGVIAGATVELKGQLDGQFLRWAAGTGVDDLGPIPDVEILYTIDLPSGMEYTFTLKGSQNQGLKFENEHYFEGADRSVVEGIHKSLLERSLIEALDPTQETPEISELLTPHDGDPMKIDTLEEFQTFVQLKKNDLYEKLITKAEDIINLENKNGVDSELAEPEAVKRQLLDLQTFLHQNPDTSPQYRLASEDTPQVLNEALERIEKIQDSQKKRQESPGRAEAHARRLEMGYPAELPEEGIALDIEHVLMDTILSHKKGGQTRSYVDKYRFMGPADLEMYLSDELDREYREIIIHDPVTDEVITHSGVSSIRAERLNDDLQKDNLERAEHILRDSHTRMDELSMLEDLTPEARDELVRLQTIVRGYGVHRKDIEANLSNITNIRQEMIDKIKQTPPQDKANIRRQYEGHIRSSRESLQEAYVMVLGGKKEWNKIAKQVAKDKTSNIIKFAYALNAGEEVRLDEEKIRGDTTGRAAHSELNGGENVYGAGELVYTKSSNGWVLTEINNGSGHYRPSALTLGYVSRVLQNKGIDISRAQLTDSLQRGAQLPDTSII